MDDDLSIVYESVWNSQDTYKQAPEIEERKQMINVKNNIESFNNDIISLLQAQLRSERSQMTWKKD
ncbi:hypothetical protein BRC91_01785 [Halobacteriales archaeon QS_4_62_28]|nr:MAG: hypothetical protein BRC91_01785 [Halobacteriales archaeon QS_4_62_28]